MQIQQWLQIATQQIKSHTPNIDAEILLCERLGKNKAYLRAYSDKTLDNRMLEQLNRDCKKLSTGYPLAYLLEKKDFWDMQLFVDENTLIPRPDTETLIETLQTLYDKKTAFSVIDLGTGSGAIAITITRVFPNATVWASELPKKALIIAKQNANRWAKSPIQFIQNSWLQDFDKQAEKLTGKTNILFDCIISNPPYIDENDEHLQDLTFEPITALTAKNNGLSDIETIISQSKKYLKPQGYLLLEHGYNQASDVRALFNTENWKPAITIQDIAGNDRVTFSQILL